MSHESREERAKKLLTVEAVRDAASKAACDGLTFAVIPLGPAMLSQTAAATALQEALKGFKFEWLEGVDREGKPSFELRILWELVKPQQ